MKQAELLFQKNKKYGAHKKTMVLLFFFLTFSLATLSLSLMAARSDVRSMTIDNAYSLFIVAAFAVCYLLLFLGGKVNIFGPLWSHLAAGVLMFILTAGLFALGALGGADSKLTSALALWVGLKGLPVFLIFMTLIGGLLGVMTLLLERKPVLPSPIDGSWIARAQSGERNVPYGIAIAGGALAAFIKLGYVMPDHWSVFLM